jgi:nucleotidyltransferase/DNA polymerase involved in DNA repair
VDFSKRINAIYDRFTDLVEPFSIDESWLDVTASQKLFGSGEEIAECIRRAVKEEIGVTVSIGVSFNKMFAKIGSDYKKPDAITVISRENFRQIIHPMSVDSMMYVGARTAAELRALGIRTDIDLEDEMMGAKVKRYRQDKVPYTVIVGDKEAAEGTVSLKIRGGAGANDLPLDTFLSACEELVKTNALTLKTEF